MNLGGQNPRRTISHYLHVRRCGMRNSMLIHENKLKGRNALRKLYKCITETDIRHYNKHTISYLRKDRNMKRTVITRTKIFR